MISQREYDKMMGTEKGRKEINNLIEQRKLEMESILPGFFTVLFDKKIYSNKGIAECQ